MFSEREIKLIIHKALTVINILITIYCTIAGMHFTFNSYNGMPTNVVAIICYVASIYAFFNARRYDKSVRYLERKPKSESEN